MKMVSRRKQLLILSILLYYLRKGTKHGMNLLKIERDGDLIVAEAKAQFRSLRQQSWFS